MSRRHARRRVLLSACVLIAAGCGPAAGDDVSQTPPNAVTASPSPLVSDALRPPAAGALFGVAASADRVVAVGSGDAGGGAAWTWAGDGWRSADVRRARRAARLDAVAIAGATGVAFGGDGSGPSRMWTARDGGWRAADAEEAGIDGRVNAVTVAGNRWIAVGDRVDPEGGESYEGMVWVSDDGEAFQPVATALELDEGTLSDVAAADGTIVVTGFDVRGGRVWASDDDLRLSPAEGAFAAATVEGVAATDDGFVALGRGLGDQRPRTWISSDGRAWERIDDGDGDLTPDDEIRDVTTVDGVAVAITGGPAAGSVYRFRDGGWRLR